MRLAAAAAVLATTVAVLALVASAATSTPAVTIAQPKPGQSVRGWVTFTVKVAHPAQVRRVDYYVDRRRVGSGVRPPSFGRRWDSGGLAAGRHSLLAVVHDAAGRRVSSPVRRFFTVAKPTAPPTSSTCPRPYSASSPWNTPVGAAPRVVPESASLVGGIGSALTSDPSQYTYPVYYADASSPVYPVALSGRYSNVTGESTLVGVSRTTVSVPIPPSAVAAAGSDAQVIILDRVTGDEWGFWQLHRGGGGGWSATNGYHYNTNWSGVPPRGFGSRGAGVPYLAGLVRPCEIAQGHIDHALAFAYGSPSGSFVWPATKSDGGGSGLPEGARLQLDPSLTDAQLQALGVTGPALVVAHALQRYGMYLIDVSGRPKLMFEYGGTANWNGLITAKTVSSIPVSALRWIEAR